MFIMDCIQFIQKVMTCRFDTPVIFLFPDIFHVVSLIALKVLRTIVGFGRFEKMFHPVC